MSDTTNANQIILLLIEDELPIRRFLRASLPASQYRIVETDKGREGIQLLAVHNPQVVLLDLGLPDIDGIEVTKEIRSWSKTPIIVLSARGQESDKIAALDAGADDYLTKPFAVGELLARLRAVLRRAESRDKQQPVVRHGSLEIDFTKRYVALDGEEKHLTPKEFKLLSLLVRYEGCVVTHKEILTEVWGKAFAEDTHYLRVFMSNLRHKIEKEPARPKYLITEPGVGYRFCSGEDGAE